MPSAIRARGRIDERAPDVVHVQWLGIPRYDRRWLRKLAAAYPVAITAHEILPPRSAHQVRFWREIFSAARRVVVHTPSSGERLVSLGVDPARIVEIPHPAFAASDGAQITTPSGATLLFFGLIREYKGLDVLIRALPEIVRIVPDARLVVAGDALDPVDPHPVLAASLGVADRIDWRLGYVPGVRIPALMEEATLVVLP